MSTRVQGGTPRTQGERTCCEVNGHLAMICQDCEDKLTEHDILLYDLQACGMGIMSLLQRMTVLPCDGRLRGALTLQFIEHLLPHLPKHLQERWNHEVAGSVLEGLSLERRER